MHPTKRCYALRRAGQQFDAVRILLHNNNGGLVPNFTFSQQLVFMYGVATGDTLIAGHC
jgi:hypothetical protein